jgi:hypothetical protein
VALPFAVGLEGVESVSAIASSNGITTIPARLISSCRMGMKLLPLPETRTICVSNNVTVEFGRTKGRTLSQPMCRYWIFSGDDVKTSYVHSQIETPINSKLDVVTKISRTRDREVCHN